MSRKQWGHGFNSGYRTGKKEQSVINIESLLKLSIFDKIFVKEECYIYNKKHELKFKCSSCGYEYIHQYFIEIFDRDEDEKECLHVTVNEKRLLTDRSNKSNPSPRRQGIRIKFYCESCPYDTVMEIYQHKGETFVDILSEKPIDYKERMGFLR